MFRLATLMISLFFGVASAETTRDAPKEFTGEVFNITDGDTFSVLIHRRELYEGKVRAISRKVKVRLEGIDAPEKDQPFGMAARKRLSKLLKNKKFAVRHKGEDKYGRVLGELMIDGKSANVALVTSGYAWHYKQYNTEKLLAERERHAREKKLGLWRDPNSIPPWEWRKLSKKEKTLAITGREKPATKELASSELTHWLNTKSNVRHNSSCRWFGKTKNGISCTADDGKPCSQCGG